jgi:poly(A) polymerase
MWKRIIERLEAAGFEAFLCGGAVRDLVMELTPNDYDVTTNATPEQIASLFEKTLLVGASFGTVVVVEGDDTVEVTTYRTDGTYSDGRRPDRVTFGTSFVEDVKRRDFTINGLLMKKDGTIIDLVGGLEDIRYRVIRTIGDPIERFAEDKLRILRAIRFACRFKFSIEVDVWRAMYTMANTVKGSVSCERIRDEITAGITGQNPKKYMEYLHYCDLLEHLLPDMTDMIGCYQPKEYHPEGDVWNHTLEMLVANEKPEMAWACLLHDVGKPSCHNYDNGKITFHGHNATGADIAREILTEYKFSNDFIDTVTALVRNHMDPMNVKGMKGSTFKKFISRPTHDMEMALHYRDCFASNQDYSDYNYIMLRKVGIPINEVKPEALIKGRDLIDSGIKPGPQFKHILEKVYDAQLNGEITTKEEALKLAMEE